MIKEPVSRYFRLNISDLYLKGQTAVVYDPVTNVKKQQDKYSKWCSWLRNF